MEPNGFSSSHIHHALSFLAGCILSVIVTRFVLPGVDWRLCRQFGFESVAQQRSPCRPSLELFSDRAEHETYQQIRLNGTPDARSAFRGPPSQEVDQSWAKYWSTWIFSVDEEAFLASQPEYPDAAARLPDGRYMATFEATHQLHCLYNLFRATYREQYVEEQADFDADPSMWHQRIDHCTEILRQKLECDRDTTVMTYNWVRGRKNAVLNFNSARMCPRWEILEKTAARTKLDGLPSKPRDATELTEIP
ncbi:hypothetical protein F5B18DRAFT_272100 [Nemania serpens]|nr:hypothetical protein F5B18DRAFT_272100 [Nemania serpens]